ncbi:MAG: aldo/keto reductase [Pseudomonadales bacterium]|jgi:aryl-alcohol dehydrogenase-like predicted oxidoreductase|nr:aldo/keto reductase [Pseudomonadales bacterium]
MEQRRLGTAGPEVSVLGYGAMSFSDFYGPATDEGSFRILDACVDFGITHVDTSNVYGMGRSETVIGRWLQRRGGEAPFRIATKAGIQRDPDRRFNNDPEHLRAELEGSLRRLGVDCIDLYYIHRRDRSHEIEAVTETLAGFVREGKVRAIGFSEIAPSSLRRAAAIHPVAAVQSEYSLQTRSPELGLVQTCRELGAALVAFSPVGRGLLTDRPHSQAQVQDIAFLRHNPRFTEPNHSANLAKNGEFRALAAELGVPAATLAIAWVCAQAEHVLPIPGTRSVEHLHECVRGAELALSDEDLARVEAVLPVGWCHGDRYTAAQWEGPERWA